MDMRRMVAIQVQLLEQLCQALQDMPEEDVDKLMKGELRVSVSIDSSTPRRSIRRKHAVSSSDEMLESVRARLNSANSQDEGVGIVKEAFGEVKDDLFRFAKYLDLPVQKKDRIDRILDKVVNHTVGRRLGRQAVRGNFGKVAGSNENM